MEFEGEPCQKYGFKGGASQRIWCGKGGGSPKELPLSLVVTASNNANISARMPKNSISKVLKIQISRESMPLDPPTLLYTHGNVNPFLASAGLFLND